MVIIKTIINVLILSFILGIISNTLHHKLKNYKVKLIVFNSLKSFHFKEVIQKLKHEIIYFFRNMDTILLIKKYTIFRILIYFAAFSSITILNSISTTNVIVKYFGIAMFIIALIGVGELIHTNIIKDSMLYYILSWIGKYCIFLIYTLSLILVYIDKIDLKVLSVCIIVLLTYSFLFLKNIIDTFKSYLFQLFNFIVVLIGINLFLIGLTFGLFYLGNNEVYEFFDQKEINNVENDFNNSTILMITIKGLEPFFNYKYKSGPELTTLSFIPILENILGNVYFLLIIGFFVSYSTGMLIDRKSKTNNKQYENEDSK